MFLDNKIIFPGTVIDNRDPMMLNRVRASAQTETCLDVIRNIPANKLNETRTDLLVKYQWTNDDPLVCLPLLPFFVNQTPKIGEYVNFIYSNKEYKFENVYYIQGMFSSPMRSPFDDARASQTFTSQGTRNLNTFELKIKGTNDYASGNTNSRGVYPEPGENGYLGRGTSDLLIRDNSVVLRAGKSTNLIPSNPSVSPSFNPSRAFSELNYFDRTRVSNPPVESLKVLTKNQFVSKLVEWEILNPDNSNNVYNIDITLYTISPQFAELYGSKEFANDYMLNVNPSHKLLLFSAEYFAVSSAETINLINNFIRGLNDGVINMPQYSIFDLSTQNIQQFPFVFRPGCSTYNFYSNNFTNATYPQYITINQIFSGICLNEASTVRGGGLVSLKDQTGLITSIQKTEIESFTDTPISVTYNTQGADNVVLLSHKSAISGKGKIDLSTTMSGISQEFYVNEILPKTDPMVRGDQLYSFLNLIVQYLLDHYHALPMLPPRPSVPSGVTKEIIQTEFANFSKNVLNQNIRIN